MTYTKLYVILILHHKGGFMKNKKLISLALSAVLATTTIFSVGALASTNAEENGTTVNVHTPAITSKTDETTVSLLSGDVYEFAKNYKINVSSPDVAKYCDGTTKFAPTPAKIEWADSESAEYYTVKLSKNADLTNAEYFASFTCDLEVEDLFMGTKYYYQIIAHRETETVKSQIFSFTTAYLPRTIYFETTQLDSNTRDIGGYYTEDGKYRVKQGIAFRGAEVKIFTDEAKNKLLYELGIKTELALHNETTCYLEPDSVNYIYVDAPHYVNYGGIHYAFRAEALAQELLVFANPDNYPVYFHCQLGRDRTGTLAFLLNALCGVGAKDLYLDYELAYLSQYGSLAWDTNGTPKAKTGQFDRMFKFINEGVSYEDTLHDNNGDPVTQDMIINPHFDETDTTLAQRTATFLKGQLGEYGITDEVIAAIRNNMLEEV